MGSANSHRRQATATARSGLDGYSCATNYEVEWLDDQTCHVWRMRRVEGKFHNQLSKLRLHEKIEQEGSGRENL